jgi:hypothetical protein
MTPLIYSWAARHRVSAAALHELQAVFGMHGRESLAEGEGVSESAVQAAVRLEAGKKGVYLWRNNVGALIDDRGVPVRYGLANESKAMNERIKSSDLIGWRGEIITPDRVGQMIGRGVMRECKKVGWRYTGNPHELAQLNFLLLATASGCDAAFCTGPGTL